jgi:hypothetical protein
MPVRQRENGKDGSVPRNRGREHNTHRRPFSLAWEPRRSWRVSANTIAFELYVEQVLAKSLHAGQIMAMDNLQEHKSTRVRTAIEAKGCQLLFATSLFIRPLSHRAKRFPNSKQSYALQEPEKPWKMPLLKHSSPSPRSQRGGDFSIAAIFFLGRKGRVEYGSIFEHAAVDL